jgi:hypothetical protein
MTSVDPDALAATVSLWLIADLVRVVIPQKVVITLHSSKQGGRCVEKRLAIAMHERSLWNATGYRVILEDAESFTEGRTLSEARSTGEHPVTVSNLEPVRGITIADYGS